MGESSFWYRPTRVVPDQRPLNGRRRRYSMPLLSMYFFSPFFLLALRSQNQRMDGLWVCYEQLGYGVILISHDWILHLIPCFPGNDEITPNFAKNLMVPPFADLS